MATARQHRNKWLAPKVLRKKVGYGNYEVHSNLVDFVEGENSLMRSFSDPVEALEFWMLMTHTEPEYNSKEELLSIWRNATGPGGSYFIKGDYHGDYRRIMFYSS